MGFGGSRRCHSHDARHDDHPRGSLNPRRAASLAPAGEKRGVGLGSNEARCKEHRDSLTNRHPQSSRSGRRRQGDAPLQQHDWRRPSELIQNARRAGARIVELQVTEVGKACRNCPSPTTASASRTLRWCSRSAGPTGMRRWRSARIRRHGGFQPGRPPRRHPILPALYGRGMADRDGAAWEDSRPIPVDPCARRNRDRRDP